MKIFNRARVGTSLNELEDLRDQRYILNMAEGEDTAVLDIFDVIDSWWGYGVRDLSYRLSQLDEPNLLVRVNSPGGEVTEGIGIANLLKMHKADVETIGIGLVASIATVILAAGKVGHRTMAANAFYMIHEPWMYTVGGADELESAVETLKEMRDVIANIYVNCIESNGKLINDSRDETKTFILDEMSKERWYSAQKAFELGLIDKVVQEEEFVTFDTVEQLEEDIEVFNSVPNIILNKIKEVKMSKTKNIKTEEKGMFAKLRGIFNKAVDELESESVDDAATNDDASDTSSVQMTDQEMIDHLESNGHTVTTSTDDADDSADDAGDDGSDSGEEFLNKADAMKMIQNLEKKIVDAVLPSGGGGDSDDSEKSGLNAKQTASFNNLAKMVRGK